MGHRERLAKLMADAASGGDHLLVDMWPGMTSSEAYRVWYGPDSSRWPGRSAKVIFLVNGFLVARFSKEIGGAHPYGSEGDFPYEMFEQRNDLMFGRWWRLLCERADAIRARRVPDGSKSLYQWLRDVGYDGDGGVNEWPWDVPL